jgi:hypothetical protein
MAKKRRKISVFSRRWGERISRITRLGTSVAITSPRGHVANRCLVSGNSSLASIKCDFHGMTVTERPRDHEFEAKNRDILRRRMHSRTI